MATAMALGEMGAMFLAVCATLLVTLGPALGDASVVSIVLSQALVLSLSWGVAFYVNDLYDVRALSSFGRFAAGLPTSITVTLILLVSVRYLVPARLNLGGPFTSAAVMSVAVVVALRAVSYAIIKCSALFDRILILGATPLARKLIDEIQNHPHMRYVVVGVVDDSPTLAESPFRALAAGSLAQLGAVVDRQRPDRIVVALGERRGRLPVGQLLESLTRRIVIEDGVDMYERLTGKLAIESLMPSRLIFSRDFFKSRLNLMLGRLLSVLLAAIGLTILAPVFALIALAVKLDSAGPVFFVQDRVGRLGRRFRLIKFRTMHPVNERTSEWVCDNGERITRVGKWLRKFRLDELPQFINILRGDMNVVGPRPHPVSNFELFMTRIPHYPLRGIVRPGMTGWAQVRYGYANNLEEETEKMRYDLYYIKRMSPWVDLRILFATVKIVALGRNSATILSPPIDAARQEPLPELNRAA
jgi:exopolysaccharide biosynthesis polyprenyl glycosylphosphotransferase